MYYDRQGRSITLAEFAALHTEDYYLVALTEFGEVSVCRPSGLGSITGSVRVRRSSSRRSC